MPDIPTVLSTLRMETDEELAPIFYTMEDLWERKLWYQLTEEALVLFKDERSKSVRHALFNQFISTFDNHIDKLLYVTLASNVSEALGSPQQSLEFLKKIEAGIDAKKDREAHVYSEMMIADINMDLGEQLQAKKLLDSASKELDDQDSLPRAVAVAYYKVWYKFYKYKRDHNNVYKSILKYLGFLKYEELSETYKQAQAHELAIEALLGDRVYNFGELILHPVFQTLEGDYKWLKDLVLAFNAGDIPAFQNLRPKLAQAPVLEESLSFLEQKICLMAFIEIVFRRPTSDRVLDFDTIAKETHLHAGSKVEVLVLKAFSIGLAKGSIDQVNRTVTVTWLQPRVLDRQQLLSMRERLDYWDVEVENLGTWMNDEGKSVWIK